MAAKKLPSPSKSSGRASKMACYRFGLQPFAITGCQKTELVVNSILKIDNSAIGQYLEISFVKTSLKKLSDVVQMNSATSEETAAASEELLSQAEILHDQILRFKLNDEQNGNRLINSIAPEIGRTHFYVIK